MRLLALALAGVVTVAAQERPVPPVPDSRTAYADSLWSEGMFDEADAIYASELARDPASARARFGVARSLAMRSRLTDALREVTAARAAAPDDGAIVGLQGNIYERLYRYPEAAAAYEESIELAPQELQSQAEPTLSRIALLRSFDGRQPIRIEPDALRAYTVPFSLVSNKILMKARINGASAELVLDTGSERTTISERTARRAGVTIVGSTLGAGVGVPGVTRLGIGSANRIDLGGMRIRDVPVSVRPVQRIGGIPAWQNEIFSPIALGLSTVIDYQRHRVTFSRHLDEHTASVRLPLRIYRLPLVRGVLNTTLPAYFVVDTGGEMISISADTATALHMTPPRHIPLRVFGMSGLDADAFLLPGVDVAFEDIEYRNFGLAVLNLRVPSALLGFQVGGIVGHRFLGGHRVTLDIERSELQFD
jgi:hypothetical protein